MIASTAAPAAHAALTAVVRKGTLVIRGDDGNDTVQIDRADPNAPPDELRLTPEDGTTLNGDVTPVVVSGVTADVRLLLGGGDNRVSTWDVVVHGNFVAKTGRGSDDISLGLTHVDGDLVLKLGPGDNRFGFVDSSRALGDMLFRGGSGDDDVSIAASSGVGGRAKLDFGGGANSFIAADAGVAVGTDLLVRGGKGPDYVFLNDDSHVTGAARLALGDGANGLDIVFSSVGGDVRFTGGRDPDSVALSDGGYVFGSAHFSLGDGDNAVTFFIGGVDGDLSIEGGAQRDAVEFGEYSIAGATQLALGGGANALVADDVVTFGDGLAVTARGGDDTVTFTSHITILDAATFQLGNGNNAASFQDTTVAGDLVIATGKGDDTILLFDTTTVGGQTLIETGSGNDFVGP